MSTPEHHCKQLEEQHYVKRLQERREDHHHEHPEERHEEHHREHLAEERYREHPQERHEDFVMASALDEWKANKAQGTSALLGPALRRSSDEKKGSNT